MHPSGHTAVSRLPQLSTHVREQCGCAFSSAIQGHLGLLSTLCALVLSCNLHRLRWSVTLLRLYSSSSHCCRAYAMRSDPLLPRVTRPTAHLPDSSVGMWVAAHRAQALPALLSVSALLGEMPRCAPVVEGGTTEDSPWLAPTRRRYAPQRASSQTVVLQTRQSRPLSRR